MKLIISALFVIFPLLFSGCSIKSKKTSFELDRNISSLQSVSWWKDEERGLANILDHALKNSYFLNAKNELLTRSKLVVELESSQKYPNLNLNTQADTRSNITQNQKIEDSLAISFDSAYKIDIWGEIEKRVESRYLQAIVSQEQLKDVTMILTLDIAQSYYKIEEYIKLDSLLQKQIELASRVLEAIKARFLSGKARYSDILQQKSTILSLENELKNIKSALEVEKGKIEYLSGLEVDLDDFGFEECKEIDISSIDVAKTVHNLPTVKSSLYLVKAKDASLYEVIAKQYPSLSLSLSISSSSDSFGFRFEEWIFRSLLKLAAPIFDANRLENEEKIARSTLKEAFFTYKDTALKEINQLESTLINLKSKKSEVEILQKRLKIQNEAFEIIKEQYIKGIASYLEVVSALERFQDLEKRILAQNRECKIDRSKVISKIDIASKTEGDFR